MGMTIDNVLEILEKHKLHIPSNVFYELKADIVNFEEPTTKKKLEVDAVSRKAVINQIFYSTDNNGDVVLGSALRERIARLPSVTPQEPKTGHWIDKQRLFESCSAECSSCHKRSNGYLHDNGFSLVSKYFDFCPKCGSDNREVEDGECK